jgi:predicted flap endonuclease-1-like 5' DNA nuclease
MSYKVVEIEGIGETYAKKLQSIGIRTTENLLQKGGSKKGRESIAKQTGLPESLILTWVNHADLFRIKGIAAQFSELLEASGVDSVKELANRNAESLHAKLVATNNEYMLSGRVPSLSSLREMIASAKKMKAAVTH